MAPRATVLRSLRAVVAALQRSARSIERRTGITNAQLFILRQLAATPSLSVNGLAERAHTHQSTMSTVVGRLVRSGLVHKSRSPADARQAVVSLTAKGRRVLQRAPTPPTEELIRALASLSDRDVRALARGLDALVSALGLRTDEAPMLFEESPASDAERKKS